MRKEKRCQTSGRRLTRSGWSQPNNLLEKGGGQILVPFPIWIKIYSWEGKIEKLLKRGLERLRSFREKKSFHKIYPFHISKSM